MLDHLADSTIAMVFVKDMQGRYVFINRGYELVHRVSRESYLGKTDYDLFPKDAADAYCEADRRVLDTREVLVTEERRTYKDGAHTVVVVKFPLIDAKGDSYGVCGVATDITQRIDAETRMRMLSAAVDQASDMVAMFELTPLREWRIFYVNDTFVKMTGYDRADVIGHTSRFLEGPRTNVEESNRRRALLARGIPCRAEVAYYRRDGSIFWVELNARPLHGPDGNITHTIVLYRDITQRRIEEELESLEGEDVISGGVYKRAYFERVLEGAAHDARVNGRMHGVVSIATQPLADVAAVAQIFSERLRTADVLATIGADELGLLLRYCSLAQAERLTHELLDALDRAGIRASAGVAQIDPATALAAQALQQAREARARTNSGGANRVGASE